MIDYCLVGCSTARVRVRHVADNGWRHFHHFDLSVLRIGSDRNDTFVTYTTVLYCIIPLTLNVESYLIISFLHISHYAECISHICPLLCTNHYPTIHSSSFTEWIIHETSWTLQWKRNGITHPRRRIYRRKNRVLRQPLRLRNIRSHRSQTHNGRSITRHSEPHVRSSTKLL